MTEETAKDISSSTSVMVMKDRDSLVFYKEKNVQNRRLWWNGFVIGLMLLSVIALTIGLGIGMKSSSDNNYNFKSTSNNAETIAKTSWPELIGMDADNASAWMNEHHPEYDVKVVNYGEFVTTDYNLNRVRIYRAPNGTVSEAPKLGR